MNLSGSLFPKYATTRFLALALALAVAVGLAACDSSPNGNDDGDNPTVTYEAIEGEWAGTSENSNWERVEFRTDSVRVGKELGALFEFESEEGELICQANMSALSSDPARDTYWARYVIVEGSCPPSGTYRFTHNSVNETLLSEYKPDTENEYQTSGTLSRKDD